MLRRTSDIPKTPETRGTDSTAWQVIHLHLNAPGKPVFGAPCNGCGACCAAEPCPLSRLMLGHRHGSCPALQWNPAANRYFCGMVVAPASFLPQVPRWLQGFASRLCQRWIAAGKGCDFDAEFE